MSNYQNVLSNVVYVESCISQILWCLILSIADIIGCVWNNCSLQEEKKNVVYEDIRWKGFKIILERERASFTNYWYFDEREGIKTIDNR